MALVIDPRVPNGSKTSRSGDLGILEPLDRRGEIWGRCRLLIAPSEFDEVRIPKARRAGTVSGYFEDHQALADAVLAYDGRVPEIFITLNPCKAALLARAANRLQTHAAVTTSDLDIERRLWLLIDCDPVRPAGIWRTDMEHGRAMTVACGIWDELSCAGWPDPVITDSGNGAHLLYRLDRRIDANSSNFIKRVLIGIAERCGTDDVDVDTTVHNAGRITKLYGTMACKGDSISNRPQRRARLLEIPLISRVLEAL